MDWEVLIPILMFAFPVIVALLDKRAKQRRKASQSRPRNSFSPRPDASEGLPRKRPAAPDPSQPSGWAPPSYDAEGGTVSLGRSLEASDKSKDTTVFRGNSASSPDQEQTEEGVRAIHRKETKKAEQQAPADKLKIDKKKLILYSEILKPKYDA